MTSINLNDQIDQLRSQSQIQVHQLSQNPVRYQGRKDQCWWRTLFYAFLFLIGEGICLLYRGNIQIRKKAFSGQNFMVAYFFELNQVIIFCVLMSILIASFLTVLMEIKAKITTVFVFVLNTAFYIAFIVAGVHFNLPWLSIVFAAGLFIFIAVAILKRKSISRGFILMNAVSYVLDKNKKVYVWAFTATIISGALISVYFYGLLGAFAYKGQNGTYFAFELLLHSYYFLGLLFNIVVYYSLLFAFTQIYSGEKSTIVIIGRIILKLGSIFKAALNLIIIASFKKLISGPNCSQRRNESLLSKFTSCYFCVNKEQKKKIFYMDHNAIIGMSLFNKQYQDSINTIQNLTSCHQRHYQQIFKSVECFTDFIGLQFESLSIGVPALVGLVAGYKYNINNRHLSPQDAFRDGLIVSGIIVVISAFLVNMILVIIPSCMSNLFILFCGAQKQRTKLFKSKVNFRQLIHGDIIKLFGSLEPVTTTFSQMEERQGKRNMIKVQEGNPQQINYQK